MSAELNVSDWLTDAQLDLLRRHGEERTAEIGDVLYRVGDHERTPAVPA